MEHEAPSEMITDPSSSTSEEKCIYLSYLQEEDFEKPHDFYTQAWSGEKEEENAFLLHFSPSKSCIFQLVLRKNREIDGSKTFRKEEKPLFSSTAAHFRMIYV